MATDCLRLCWTYELEYYFFFLFTSRTHYFKKKKEHDSDAPLSLFREQHKEILEPYLFIHRGKVLCKNTTERSLSLFRAADQYTLWVVPTPQVLPVTPLHIFVCTTDKTVLGSLRLPPACSIAEFRLKVLVGLASSSWSLSLRNFNVVSADGTVLPRVDEMRVPLAAVVSVHDEANDVFAVQVLPAPAPLLAKQNVEPTTQAAPPAPPSSVPPPPRSSSSLVAASVPPPQASSPIERPCCFFKASGSCRFANCKFSHDAVIAGCNKGAACKKGHYVSKSGENKN